ncbi:unnamed protein product, partial [Ectocarpus sp. 4 AP-2014]
AAAAEKERGDALLASITAGQPGSKLPLVPAPDETFVSRDTGITVLVESLSPRFALFLVSALMLEQPVLLVAAPGSNELLMHAASGLLRLLRPLQWQHLYIPLLPMSCRHVLKHAVDAKEPFLIGTCTTVLESFSRPGHAYTANSTAFGGGGGGRGDGNLTPPPNDAQNSSGGGGSSTIPPAALYHAHALSEGGQRHITIADLSQGVIHPSKMLELAAACTIGASVDIDSDSEMRSLIFSHFRGTQNRGSADRSRTTGWGWSGGGSGAGPVDPGDYDTDEANASMAMLPAVPCRFRYQLAGRLKKQGEGVAGGARHNDGSVGAVRGARARARPYGGSGGGGGGGGGFDAGGGPSGGVDQAAVVTRLLQTPVYSASEGRPDGGDREDSLVASRTGEALRLFLFNMMVTLFKGYHIFIRPPDSGSGEEDYGDDAATTVAGGSAAAVDSSGGGGGGGGRAGHGQESNVEFDVLGFLSFAQADLRPFLRALLRTKAFAAFLADARGWTPSAATLQASQIAATAEGASSRLSRNVWVGEQREESARARRRRDEPTSQQGQSSSRQAPSRSREHRATAAAAPTAATDNTQGRRSSDSGGMSAPGGEERGSSSRHASGTSVAGGDGFRLNLERAITTRMQEQLQVQSAVGTERMGAFLLTYYTHSQHVAPQSSAAVDMGHGFGQGSLGGALSPTAGGGGGG